MNQKAAICLKNIVGLKTIVNNSFNNYLSNVRTIIVKMIASLIMMVGLSLAKDMMEISPMQRVMQGTSVELMCGMNISDFQV